MGDWSRYRPIVFILVALVAMAVFCLPRTGEAAPHNIGNDCYACHNIRSGQVWQGSYSVWSGKPIGMSSYGKPITCEVCHTNYGTGRFTSSSASHHPVQVISGSSMATDNWTTTVIRCKDCHNADTVTNLTPNLTPDLAPSNYTSVAGNTAADGYPNHDVASPDNQVNAGDPAHLLAMRLSGSERTVSGSGTYTRLPSSTPATDYGFCFSCHDGSGNTSRGATDNILDAYVKKGHYFKSSAPTGGAINDRIPCSDCHASHNSVTNARLFEPDDTTWTGTRPTGLAMANESSPTASETRAICMFCHEDYSVADTTTTAKQVRGVQPIRRKYGVTGHAPADTQSCNDCHDTHNPPAGGDDCLNCHRTGGGVQTKHQMVDLEFPADGTWNAGAGEDSASVQVSGHKGVVYTTPFNTKALNECKKCHGTSHPTDAAKVQAADGTSTWPTGFVYGLSWSGSAWSANASSFADGNTNNIIDGNEFCLSCHDGVDALDAGGKSNIRIGGVDPPKVWYPSGGQSTGHDRKSGSNYPVSGNAPAQQLCTSCHKYHTSDRAQLFPGDVGSFGAGNGYTYSMPTWGGIATNWQAPKPATGVKPSIGGRMVLGTVNANALNFTDRSNPSSGKGFGTAGDNTGTNGLCNACHRDADTVTAGTLNAAHTHEGNGVSPSKNTFVKDCVECHDPHGGGGATPNLSMIREYVGRDNTSLNAVVFTARTGANSFDENDGATESNTDDVCATCHSTAISHNFRTEVTAGDHNQGTACTSCHPHGQTDNAAKSGFPQAACNTCHGSVTDAAGMPASDDLATYHVDANPVLGTRALSPDNTAHRIHVNYLVNKRGVTRGNSCYVCHMGGGSQESHPGNTTYPNFKTGTQPDNAYVQVALDNGTAGKTVLGGTGVWFGTGKPQPSYSGVVGLTASATNGWKTCNNTTCHYAESPSWSGKRQVVSQPGALAVDSPTSWPATGNVSSGSTNNVIDKIRLAADATGGVNVTALKVRLTTGATAGDTSDISAVKFYEDADNDNVIDNPGSPLGGGAATFSGADNSYTRSGISLPLAASQTRYVLVAVDIASGATNGRTVIVQAVDNTYVTSDATLETLTSFTSNTFTVVAPGNLTVTSTADTPAGGNVSPGTDNNYVEQIQLAAASGGVTVSSIKVKQIGTAANSSDIGAVRFYLDANADGVADSSTPLGGGNATFSSADNTYAVSSLSLSVPSGATYWVLVKADIASGATGTMTVTTQVNAGYVSTSSGTVNAITPFDSATFTIQAPGVLTVSTPDGNPGAGSIGPGATNNPVDKMVWQTDTGAVTVGGFTISETNTATNSDIANLKVWEDGGTVGQYDSGVDILVGTATWSGSAYVASGLSYTIPASATRNLLITADVAASPTAGNILVTRVDAVTPSSGTVNAFTPFASNQFTIQGPVIANGKFPTGSIGTSWIATGTAQDAGSATADGTESARLTTSKGNSVSFSGNVEQTLATRIPNGQTGISVGLQFQKNWGIAAATAQVVQIVFVDAAGTGTQIAAQDTSIYQASGWLPLTASNITANFEVAKVRVAMSTTTGGNKNATSDIWADEVYVTYGGRPQFAPPRTTGDSATYTAACDTCHQFGPRDDSLSSTTYGNPTTGSSTDQYYYTRQGDHIKHGAGDPQNWVSPAPGPSNESSLTTPCNTCHGSIAAYGADHADGTKQVLGSLNWNGTSCGSFGAIGSCHYAQPTPDWGTGSTTCTTCHTTQTSGIHLKHLGNAYYVPAVGAPASQCNNCHNGATHNGTVQNSVSYNSGNGTCSNSCHNVADTRDWTSGTPLACTDCHSGSYIGGGSNAPASGLHATTAANMISGNPHDNQFQASIGEGSPSGTCTTCHTASPSTAHLDNVFNTSYPTIAVQDNVGFRDGTPPTCFTKNGLDACHVDSKTGNRTGTAVAGPWGRLWSNTADDTGGNPDARCNNCHGTWWSGQSFRDNVVHRQGDLAAKHDAGGTCNECHAYEDAAYSKTYGTGNHGNQIITINDNTTSDPPTPGYSNWRRGTGGDSEKSICLKCHTGWSDASPSHWFQKTWATTQEVPGHAITVACGACHAAGQLPPTSGSHTAHFASIGAGSGSNTDYTECEACHGNNGGLGWDPIQGTHNNTTVNFSAAVTYSGGANGTCSTTNCHGYSTNTSQWGVSSSVQCNECHYWATSPTGSGNSGYTPPLSTSHSDHFDHGKTCSACHPYNASDNVVPRTHINNTGATDGAKLTNKAYPMQDNAQVTFGGSTTYTFDDAGNTCYSATNSGLGCHATAGGAGASDPTRPVWGNAIGTTECTKCHTDRTTSAVNPTSGLHGVTAANVTKHDNTLSGGCVACHTDLSGDPISHINGTWQADQASNTESRFISRSGMTFSDLAPNNATCSAPSPATGLDGCHSDGGEWYRLWSTEANTDYTTGTGRNPGQAVCNVCHGQYPNGSGNITANSKGWRQGTVHYRSSDLADKSQENKGATHTDPGPDQCNDCHAYYSAAVHDGNNKIDFSDLTPSGYTLTLNTAPNPDVWYCETCHAGQKGQTADNTASRTFLDSLAFPGTANVNHVNGTSEPEGACGACHQDGVTPGGASATHIVHNANTDDLTAASSADCVRCHPTTTYTTTGGTHGDLSVTFDTAKVSYSGGENGTCRTRDCHNSDLAGSLQSTAWDSATSLDCDDCHYYADPPTRAGNNGNPGPLSSAHNDHFDNGKVCTVCHGTTPTDTSHISGATTLEDKATALQEEAAYDNSLATTKYVFDDTGNTCYSASNNGLGCHASAGDTGSGDATRPDWDIAFAGDNGVSGCTKCHSNRTDTATNPVSGLHSVVPTISGQQHDNTVPNGGCTACHTTLTLQTTTHQDGTFTGNGSVSGDRTKMGLFAVFTTSGTDNQGTCLTTGCHATLSDDWAHKWTYAATSATASCAGCHGDWLNGWNTGVTHKNTASMLSTHGTGTTYQCAPCHVLEAATGNYTFVFGTGTSADWYPLASTSEHGNSVIEVNSKGSYNGANPGFCTTCHTAAPFDIPDTGWTLNTAIVGDDIEGGSCIGCHNQTHTNIPANPVTSIASTYSHVTGTATDEDCKMCHHSSQSMGGASPNNIALRNADTGVLITYTQDTTQGGKADADRLDLVTFCLSCHDANGATYTTDITRPAGATALRPFTGTAADVSNIAQHWANTTISSQPNHKGGNSVPNLSKRRSAHGYPGTNDMKQPTDQSTYTDAAPVSCRQCHPAHGSTAKSPDSSKGNIGVVGNMVNPGYAEPDVCWNCHNGASGSGFPTMATKVIDYFGDSTPASLANYWGGAAGTGGTKDSEFAYKERAFKSNHNVNGTGIVCSVCHNPHGGEGGNYYVPHLRGTWLTSPYPEDRVCKMNGPTSSTYGLVDSKTGPRIEPGITYTAPNAWWGMGYGASGKTGNDGYYIDENTFGTSNATYPPSLANITRITETDADFGGLCAKCHAGTSNAGGTVANMKTWLNTTSIGATGWGTPVHNAVKGWDAQNGINPVNSTTHKYLHNLHSTNTGGIRGIQDPTYYRPREPYAWGVDPYYSSTGGEQLEYHSFPCSKCHTPHANSLSRLMVTNCVDIGTTAGQRAAHGSEAALVLPKFAVDFYNSKTGYTGTQWQPSGAQPPSPSDVAMHCHNQRKTNTNLGGGWNKVTGW